MTAALYTAVLGFWAYAQYADARLSERGFAAGYTEGNEMAVRLFGPRPSQTKLIVFNGGMLALFSSVAFFVGLPAMIAVTLAAAGKHLLSVRKWHLAFATNGASLQAPRSAWQKFLGL
jgi:hypothetical protein